jgi:hypothetical protein
LEATGFAPATASRRRAANFPAFSSSAAARADKPANCVGFRLRLGILRVDAVFGRYRRRGLARAAMVTSPETAVNTANAPLTKWNVETPLMIDLL